MLCRLTGWANELSSVRGGLRLPRDRNWPTKVTNRRDILARNIVNKFDFENNFRNIARLPKYNRRAKLIHPFLRPISCFLPPPSFHRRRYCHDQINDQLLYTGFRRLPNTLMPLSSLAAEPARITIPNEPARGGSNFFQPFSLSFFPPSRICPPTPCPLVPHAHDVAGRQSPSPPPGEGGGRESQIKINKFVCIANAGLRKVLWVERDDRAYWLTRICNFNYVPWRDVQDWG